MKPSKPEPWKRTLGYERGDTYDDVKAKAVKRLRLAAAAGDPMTARTILEAWQMAKKQLAAPEP